MLCGIEQPNTLFSLRKQRIELLSRERAVLTCPLHFNKTAFARHDHIHVDAGTHVFFIVEIQSGFTVHDTDTDGRNTSPDR